MACELQLHGTVPPSTVPLQSQVSLIFAVPYPRMTRILLLLLSLLVLPLERQVRLFVSATWTQSIFMGVWWNPRPGNATWGGFRGGQDIDDDEMDGTDGEEDQESGDGDEKETVHEPMDIGTGRPPKQTVEFKSAFRLLHEMREEVVSLAHIVTKDDENMKIEDKALVENPQMPPTIVGGGLAIQSHRKQKPAVRATLMAPASIVVDANRVAPLASRLLEESENVREDTDEGQEEVFESEGESKSTDILRLWWPNLWTQQLSELQGVNETTSTNYRKGEGGESDSVEVMDTEEPIDDRVDEFTVFAGVGAIDDMSTDSELDDTPVQIIPIHPEVREDSITDGDADLLRKSSSDDEAKSFVSTGAWISIDNLFTLGLANKLPVLKVSSKLRLVRKLSARVTGLHGVMSGKPSPKVATSRNKNMNSDDEERLKNIQKRMADIEKVREGVSADAPEQRRRSRFSLIRRDGEEHQDDATRLEAEQKRLDAEAEERRRKEDETRESARRMERVKEIDRLISEGQARLQDLVCEKDVLQRRLNPLFDYTSETVEAAVDEAGIEAPGQTVANSTIRLEASRKFKFPPDDLVQEYLDMTFSSRRIIKLNHTDLWQVRDFEDDEDESIGDDVLTPSADAFRLYQDDSFGSDKKSTKQSNNGKKQGGGSWLLRQTIGKGPSIGEKIGEVAETAAYKAVCAAVMSFLARLLSSLHGVNVMKHSDIRLVLEQAPDLPRVGEGIIPGGADDYAAETIKTVIRRKSKKARRRSKYHATEDPFVQRDAVTEMLLSHVQISAPLLKLFPLAWQRAFLGNIITLSTAIMSDFFEGLQFQILGHSLTFAFAPITQEDMINHIGLSGSGFNSRRLRAEEFEAAVRATAIDVGDNLKFLDRWHERALGSGVLRTQIANLIARIVLTLTDEILAGARMDLWSSQAGGPRMLAGLEYRTTTEERTPS